ncbi:MAG: hypothetical protein K6A65_08545, partial [Succinivibrionaceae bacterium]|nr:hypothetical protein [Succinivibrionaceae bacterium]
MVIPDPTPGAPLGPLRPRGGCSFSTFVPGGANRALLDTALAFARDPLGCGISPLYIHGASGLGKTHLLHALARACLEGHPDLPLGLWDGRGFSRHCVAALRPGEGAIGRSVGICAPFLRARVLIIDGIDALATCPRSRQILGTVVEEFLERPGGALALSGTLPPAKLAAQGFGERLATRLSSGAALRLEPLDEAGMRALLLLEARRLGLPPGAGEELLGTGLGAAGLKA